MKVRFAHLIFILILCLFFLSDVNVVYADLTSEFFATSNGNCSNWEDIANSLGSVDSIYATVSNKIPVCHWNFVTPFNIPVGSEINSIKVKVYNSSFGNIGSSSMSPAHNRVQSCIPPPFFPASIFNNVHEYTVTPTNCPVTFPTLAQLNSSLMSWHFYNSGSVTIAIDAMSMQVDYTPTVPTPTPTPVRTPLILIPGIGGSEFKTDQEVNWAQPNGHGGTFTHTYSADKPVWLNLFEALKPGEDDYFDILRMNLDGQTSQANLVLNGTFVPLAYGGFIDFFTDIRYELDKTLFLFPYDWRKNIALTASLLDQKIESIKQQTGSTKVDIVAHSMGGLVARNYISDLSKAQNVRKLFTIGTPHLGSVEYIKNLMYGGCLSKDPFKKPICFGVSPSEVQDVIQNMTGGFQLIPSQKYSAFYSGEDNLHPFSFRDDRDMDNNMVTGPLSYSATKALLTNLGYNTALFTPSEAFHSLDDDLDNTNGVEVTNIVGSGIATLGQIIEKYSIDFLGIKIAHRDIISINGDETVPLFSASLVDYGRSLSLLGGAKVFYARQNHGRLVSPGPALNLVKNILNNDSQMPNGVSVTPYSLSGTRVSVHSPVNIHAYDSFGNHTGPTSDGDFEANIPGSSYDTLEDAKFIWLSDDGQYTIKFEATDQGSFDFKIRKYENDENTETVLYDNIPLADNTKAETIFDTSGEPPALLVDEDGNGTADFEANPDSVLTGDAVSDQTPPETTVEISGREGLNGWYKSDVIVTLIPQDEGSGSGVLKTEYSLDNGQTVNTYVKPFTISAEKINKLKFRSTDKAGNEEDPKEMEIKIDKTAPEAKIFIDQDKHDLVVESIDQNPTKVKKSENPATKKKEDGVYTITDLAGNSLKLDVRERDKVKKDRFRIYSIQYNDNKPQIIDINYFNVSYNDTKDKLNIKEQNFELKGQVKIRIQYDIKKNKSTIIVKELKKEKVREVKNGLILLQLITEKGTLKYSY